MKKKLNVFLIDDRGAIDLGGGEKYPIMTQNILESHFNIIWICNAYEGRWLLDAFDELRNFDPSKLLNIGIPSEVIVFDYALSHGLDKENVRENDPTDIIPSLSNLVKQLQIDMPLLPKDYDNIPDTGTDQGEDRMGCYIGGDLARAFSSYPCGAIPTTAHMDVRGSDAAFYEWLNDRYFSSTFADKTRNLMWEPVIKLGLQEYRKRLITLTRSGLVVPSIVELQTLIENPEKCLGKYKENAFQGIFHYSTYFGKREIMLSSVFFDILFPSEDLNEYADGTFEPAIQDFLTEVKIWAEEMLSALFNTKQGFNEFMEARGIAELYFKAFLSDYHLERYEVSEYLINKNKADDFDDFCQKLLKKYPKEHVNDFKMKANARNLYEEICTEELNISEKDRKLIEIHRLEVINKMLRDSKVITIKPLYRASNNPVVIRWTVLMLMVYGEQHFSKKAKLSFTSICGCTSPEGDKRELAPTELELNTVCEMIDPLPNSLLTFYAKGKDGYTKIYNQLKSLGGGEGTWGSLGMNIMHVLEGKFNLGDENHGLYPNELNFLRAFARDIGFLEKEWPAWLKKQP